MSTQPIPDLSTISIPLRRPATPATPADAAATTPAADPARPTMADDGKSVSFDTTAGEAEAIDMDRALDLALAVADGQLTGTEAKRLGMDRDSLRTLLEATADGRIDGKELAKLAPKKGAQPAATGGTGTATGTPTPTQAQPTQTQPTATAAGESYTIKPGDTLSKIAKAYTSDPQRFKELLALNPHIKDPNKIFPGQKINLPASWSKAAPATGTGATTTTPGTQPTTTPATGTTTTPATGTETTTPATGTTTTPATGAATGETAAVSSRISSEAEVKAMQESAKYLAANFDKVAGADGGVSKEDLQKHLPEGPSKAAMLKHFDDMKFLSIDPGAEAWTNLTKNDVHEIGRTLDWRVGEGGPLDWQFHAEAHQLLHADATAFKAADRNGNGQLEGDEIPEDLRGKVDYRAGETLDHTNFSESRTLPYFGAKMDESEARVAAWKRAQGQPTQTTPTQTPVTMTVNTPVATDAKPATQTPTGNGAKPATQTPATGYTPEEAKIIAQAEADFDVLDRSGDGVINNDGGRPYGNNARFDTNKDNEISRQEFIEGRLKEGAQTRAQ